VIQEEEMATAAKKFREVEDNLYNQLKNAAAENLQLRDDKTKLQTDIHLMKKVLKKLKKHITGNPSPSGDSGISTENKIVRR
jgi:chromosome segregation ATPase